MPCQHENFEVYANVIRLTDGTPGGKVIGYATEIRVNCVECGLPFEWIGVEAGLSPTGPMASVDAQELRAPIRPKGLNILPAIPGYSVKVN